jgi:uroporphyrin-III C-methyltransferase
VVDTAKVYLVGAGPGEPDLLTRRAENALRGTGAVIHDRGINPGILALVNPAVQCVAVGLGSQEERTADVCGWYLRLASTCESIVRITLADPLLEGEVAEELEFLARHGFELEMIPGVLAETVYECRAAVREAGKLTAR